MFREESRVANAGVSIASALGARRRRTRASRANRRGPSVPETSPRADRELFLRPTGIAEDRRAPQPCATNELACGIESLRRAPSQLTADDSAGAQHTSRAGAWSGRQSDAAEGISERPDLLVTGRVREPGFRAW